MWTKTQGQNAGTSAAQEMKRELLIELLLERRQQLREKGLYDLADDVRRRLSAMNVSVNDTPAGQIANEGYEASIRSLNGSLSWCRHRIRQLEKELIEQRERHSAVLDHVERRSRERANEQIADTLNAFTV